MTAGDKLTEYAASWIADCGESYDTADEQAAQLVTQFRAQVLTETAADLKAHCLDHNRFAATGFADCPCRVADELLRMAKEASRGE